MSLKKYNQKRDFKKTREPKGKKSSQQKKELIFVVQKHAASHLHYDFRLELDGVLKSWAVPKGVSLNPAEKRLAVHVEDHPYNYHSFKGTIPKGHYGAGTVTIWDRGTWIPLKEPRDSYKKGRLEFILKGKKLKGRWNLVSMGALAGQDGKNWLLIKGHDEKSKTKEKTKLPEPLPKFFPPQLATLTNTVPPGNWIHEVKFDGYRALAYLETNQIKIFTRSGQNWSHKFPEIVKALGGIPAQTAILDGEIVKLLPSGLSSFQALQEALQFDQTQNLNYYIFDLLFLEGRDLRNEPLEERRRLLQKIMGRKKNGILRLSEALNQNHAAIYKAACRNGLEGIISKRKDRPYVSGRTQEWLKTKCHKEQEFIIVGYTEPQGSRLGFGALLLAVKKGKNLKYSGMVGTGFTRNSISSLYKKLKQLENSQSILKERHASIGARKVHWVKPQLVAEVEFTEWTRDGLVRHPSFKGLREDKPAREIVKEKPQKILKKVAKNKPVLEDEVAGVHLTHPEKILYLEQHITKFDVATYYAEIAPFILPFIKNRPLSLVRCPLGSAHKCFYQKHILDSTPKEIKEIEIKETKGSKKKYVMVNDVKGLVALAQMGVLEIHPWGSTIKNIEKPDIMTFDLDPSPEVEWKRVIQAAQLLHALLEDLKIISFVKTTGGKGLHVVIPLKQIYSWKQVKDFSHQIAQSFAQHDPKSYIAEASIAKRKGKIFIDYLRNGRGATAVAPYSPRARINAPVATPISWKELNSSLKPEFFNIQTILPRLKKMKTDPWKNFWKIESLL